ncbi:glycosyltransferase [Neobacillus sp. SM06]|uniref:glycosyltransferase n=1 Tax=Neobacillus sp. SM06 TaxID=3422492 RepID=UPI003D26528E
MSGYSISLCMIVKNEEEFLRRCLESVQSIVNEIVIVDTGSTDKTIEIAKEFNVKIYNFEWNGNFADARNFSIKNATSDYVLVLDADEYLDEGSIPLQENLKTEKDYYIVNIKNYLDSQIFNHQAIRIFKNNQGFIYKGKIHEHLNIEDYDGLTQETAKILIHHIGYTSKLYMKKNKHERNLKLLLEEVQNHPSGYNFFNLGNQYKANGQFDKALGAYKKAFYLSKDRVYLSYLLDQMGKCLLYLKRYEEGIELILNSIDGFPDYTNLYYTLGELYEACEYYKDAECCYLKCLELGDVTNQQTIEGVGGHLARFNLIRVYEKKGELSKALEEGFLSLRKKMDHLPTLMYFIKILKMGNIPVSNMKEFIDATYLIKDQSNLNNLVISLFMTRSSLLIHYIRAYNLKVDRMIEAIALQYGGELGEACEVWKSIDEISYELAEDIIALSFKIQSNVLLPKVKEHFSETDFEIINCLVNKENNIKLTKDTETLIIKVITKVGLLDDQRSVLYLLNIVTNNNSIEHVELVRNLIDIGLKEIVIEFTRNYIDKNGISLEYLEILGDLYSRKGFFLDALLIFNKIIELKASYSIYEKMYNIHFKMKDTHAMDLLEREILVKFPLAMWVKNKTIMVD